MHKGSCLCGAVHYEIDGELGALYFCHCTRCRKANGSAFLAGAPFDADKLRIVSGQEYLADYESSPGVHRIFCRQCGSPLFSRRPGPPVMMRLRVGSLDTPLPDKAQAHIFYADKAEWFDMHDELPKHAQRP
ncbi:MAG: GFA family protein [Steroidobacteraceae bacterium]